MSANTFSTPLVECFRQGEAPRDIRLMAARGEFALRLEAQLALLTLLVSDADPEVKAEAEATISRIPRERLPAVEAAQAADAGEAGEAPSTDTDQGLGLDGEGAERLGAAQRLALLTVADRMKVAMLGSREERQILVRDPNRLVSTAVLSSPKLTESEVEAIARMTNVSADVLRTVGTNRVWLKNYTVVASLTRNAKTPIPVALNLVTRLTERDIRFLSADRNIPEPVRLAARKLHTQNVARRQ